jgi:hypothetical protein
MKKQEIVDQLRWWVRWTRLLLLLHLPRVKIPWLVHHMLFGGNNYSRINSSCIVRRTTTRVFVELSITLALLDDDIYMFTIQNSHVTTFQHNGLKCIVLLISLISISPILEGIQDRHTQGDKPILSITILGTTKNIGLCLSPAIILPECKPKSWMLLLIPILWMIGILTLYQELDSQYRTVTPIWYTYCI